METRKYLTRQKGHDFSDFIVYDLETTGLSPINDEIIEIGAVKIKSNKIVDRFQKFVKPVKSSITPFIEDLTGISNSDVKDAKHIDYVLKEFLIWSEGLVLLGYNNNRFDDQFLIESAKKHCLSIKNTSYDVMWYVRSKKFPVENHKLNTIASYLSITNPRAHRALADAITTANIFIKVRNMERK